MAAVSCLHIRPLTPGTDHRAGQGRGRCAFTARLRPGNPRLNPTGRPTTATGAADTKADMAGPEVKRMGGGNKV